MITNTLVSLSLVWMLPLLGALAVRSLPQHRTSLSRRLATVVVMLTLVIAIGIFLADSAKGAFSRTDVPSIPLLLGLHYHVGVDGLSALLLPVTTAVSLCVLLAAQRVEQAPRVTAQSLFALSAVLGTLVSRDLLLLVLFWILSLIPVALELGRRGNRTARAAFNVVLFGGSLPLLLCLGGLAWHAAAQGAASSQGPFDLLMLAQPDALPAGATTTVLGCLLLLGALVRIGCFPAHLWIAPLSESGLGSLAMIAFSTPLGIFIIVRVLLPVFPGLCQQAFPFLLPLGLVTALYGAVVALGQDDLRRALGFFWMSQQGFLLSGLSSLTPEGISGALLHAIETVVARTGLLLIASAIAARVGTTDVRLLGGLAARAPRMATGFLLLSAAAIGLPGTTGFVSEDLIVQGLLKTHPVAATMLLIATALNGILLFRLFQRAFLSAPSPHNGALQLREFADLLRRERWVSVLLVGLLLAGGLFARPLLAVRQSAVSSLPTTHAAGSSPHGEE